MWDLHPDVRAACDPAVGSTDARHCDYTAPTPAPTKPASDIGVSLTRSEPISLFRGAACTGGPVLLGPTGWHIPEGRSWSEAEIRRGGLPLSLSTGIFDLALP